MQYWEATEGAREIRARAEALMDERAIAPTPTNYELWFFYALGHDQDLRHALDAAVANGVATDAVRVKEIYTRFFVHADERVEKAETQLTAQLKALSSALTAAGGEVTAYGRALDETGARLPLAKSAADLKRLIEDTARATALMEARNKALETQVDASSRKLDEMRTQMEAVRQQAMVDALTGLANRRAFDESLAGAVKDAQESHKPLCVLMCDIDRFKKFNDTWGHATGDQVLRLVASVLKANVKGRDIAARYGGEELSVILPQTTLADAVTVAEQIRASIAAKTIVKKSTAESLGQVTISIGVGQYLPGEGGDELLSRADTHLYAAKNEGRNRVCWMLRGEAAHGGSSKTASAESGAAGPSYAASKPAIELQFDDADTPIIVDAELQLNDERLVKLLRWWNALTAKAAMPAWHDEALKDIAFIRDHVHLHEIDPSSNTLLVRFVGGAVSRTLGADLTGQKFDLSASTGPAQLRATITRVFESVNLTRHVHAPLRTYAKTFHRFPEGHFSGESLWLPFQGKDREFILGATILTPLSNSKSAAA